MTTLPTPALPQAARQFIEAAIVTGDAALPAHYPRPEQWEDWQIGFRRHGITGASLVAATPGQWQPLWYVIACNDFDDPFFIDLGEAAQGFPVYYAPHGAGRWDAQQIAPNLRHFGAVLAALRDLADDHQAALRLIKTGLNSSAELWREVCQAHREQEQLWEKPDPPTTPPDPAASRHGILVITAIGLQKIKVAHFLKQALDLPPKEALALTAQNNIVIATGYQAHLRSAQTQLQALGATVEFRPDDGGIV